VDGAPPFASIDDDATEGRGRSSSVGNNKNLTKKKNDNKTKKESPDAAVSFQPR